MKQFSAILAPFLMLAAIGCGDANRIERQDVTGVVTFQGEPVPEGTITFSEPSTGNAASADLNESGEYLASLPDGTYIVTITPPMVEAPSMNPNVAPGTAPKKVDNIPPQYRSASTTDLKATVSPEALEHDFELQP